MIDNFETADPSIYSAPHGYGTYKYDNGNLVFTPNGNLETVYAFGAEFPVNESYDYLVLKVKGTAKLSDIKIVNAFYNDVRDDDSGVTYTSLDKVKGYKGYLPALKENDYQYWIIDLAANGFTTYTDIDKDYEANVLDMFIDFTAASGTISIDEIFLSNEK